MANFPVLYFVPGTLCDARLFARLAQRLRPVAHVRVASLAHLDDPQAWVKALLKEAPERFSLAGFSMGGLLALEVLRCAPQRVDRLAMIASNAEAAGPVTRRRTATNRRRLRQGGARAVIQAALPSYFFPGNRTAERYALVHDMARRTPHRSARAQFDWVGTRPGGIAQLAAFGGPLLLVSGTHDPLCPERLQRRMCAAQAAARWHALRRCGHFIPLEAPAQLAALLSRWLAQPRIHEQPLPRGEQT